MSSNDDFNDEILNESDDERETTENASSINQRKLNFEDVTIEHVCALPGEFKDSFKATLLPLFPFPQHNQTS
jgi:hypothetical protein